MAAEQSWGLLLVDKPVGPTSHDVVHTVRQVSGFRKVGHTGTLDPQASGVLVLCLGKATRLSEYLTGHDKGYEATVQFGRATNTYDAVGETTLQTGQAPSSDELRGALGSFRGEIEQVPPPFSAIRVKGKRAYELARSGEQVELRARPVTIHQLKLSRYEPPLAFLEVLCSSGTYLRSLAHDLGQTLGTGAFLAGLRRTRVGPFGLEEALLFSELLENLEGGSWRRHFISAAEALPNLPPVTIRAELMDRVRNGNPIPAEGKAVGMAKALNAQGELLAVLEATEDGRSWHPTKVFVG